MENKICKECNTVNESDYKYCKNCGALLPAEEQKTETVYENATYNYNPFVSDEIDGVKTEDLVRFVGKNADKIVPKMALMEAAKRKTSFCWPVFILTFLFGLCGAAFWFLYRRMYKWGIALLVVSLLLSAGKTVLTVNTMEGFLAGYFDVLENYTANADMTRLQHDINSLLTGDELLGATLVSNVLNALRLGISILMALFSLHIYKCHATSKIKSYGRPLTDIELMLSGGTSGGALAVGIVLYAMATATLSVILTISFLAVLL
ncbi:MAG: zinc ribbon domain-containing protein [Clostridia bacterium]|nr:zinc ribbon domain-containing protein [Clostridia bacterium]